jgi:dihydrolipoamide dehydrogenase
VVLIGIGRKPNTDGLGLQNVGIECDKLGCIIVNEDFITNVPSIRAIGDVIRGPMLAHKAEEEGINVIKLMKGNKSNINYLSIPSVIYTHPEVAWCGYTEDELKAKKIEYDIGNFPFAANSRAKTYCNLFILELHR